MKQVEEEVTPNHAIDLLVLDLLYRTTDKSPTLKFFSVGDSVTQLMSLAKLTTLENLLLDYCQTAFEA